MDILCDSKNREGAFFVMPSEATISDHPIETFADALTKRAAGTLAALASMMRCSC